MNLIKLTQHNIILLTIQNVDSLFYRYTKDEYVWMGFNQCSGMRPINTPLCGFSSSIAGIDDYGHTRGRSSQYRYQVACYLPETRVRYTCTRVGTWYRFQGIFRVF